MAEEITVSASLAVDNGIVSASLAKVGLSIDLTGSDFTHQTQVATTADAALAKGSITTLGWFFGINRSTTAAEIIEIRWADNEQDVVKIKPGEFACFRFGSDVTDPFILSASAVADTSAGAGSPVLEYLLIED